MRAGGLRRLPPAGESLARLTLGRTTRRPDAASTLSRALARRLGAERVDLLASGREALRVVLRHLAARSGRAEAVVPAYTCFSVPSAVVAAGLRVRLVDVTPEGWIDPDALAALPLERAAAVVVCNLFGVPEPIKRVRDLARAAGAAVIDDAAQALGARGPEGPAGGRGDAGILSFGRGKPLAALGGGALGWAKAPADLPPPAPPQPQRLAAALRALAHDTALSPWVFRWVAVLPGLHVGESRFEPEFPHGPIPGAALALATAAEEHLDEAISRRAERAAELARLAHRAGFTPLLAGPGAQVSPARLGLRAPSAAARENAVRALRVSGGSPMYGRSLDVLEPLARHRAGEGACPGAREFAARLLTLPTNEALGPELHLRVFHALERASDA